MSDDALAAALKVMDDYIGGLNRHDEPAVNDACNFPHVRLAGGKVQVSKLVLSQGPRRLDATGILGLDDLHRAQGRLDVTVAGVDDLLQQFGLSPKAANIGNLIAGVLGAVRKAARLPPAEAMRPEPPANFRPSLVERAGLGRLFTHSFRIALRNIERRPVQALFTIAGLALGTALLILPNTFKAGIAQILDFQWDVVQRQDLTLGLTEVSSTTIVHELEHLPGVLTVEPGRLAAVRLHFQGRNRQIAIRSLNLDGRHNRTVDPQLREVPPQTDGLTLSAKLAEVLGAQVGDTLVVEALEGRRLTKEVTLTALADDFTGIAAYMELHALNRLLGEGDVVSSASLTVDAAHKSEFLHALKGIPRVNTVAVKDTMRQSFRETTAQSMGLIQTIYLTFAVIVAFGVIYNNARISLAERARELATLRVIGMTQGEVAAVIVFELGVLAAIALPAGLLLGTGFASVIIHSVNTETVRLPLVFTSYTYAFALIVVAAASVFSALVVLRKLKQLDLIGALKAPE